MHAARRALLTGGALLIGACASLRPATTNTDAHSSALWQAHQTRLTAIRDFDLQGRIAENGLTGSRADLQWNQRAEHFELRLSGPLGVGALRLSGTPQRVTIRTKDGEVQTPDPAEFMRQQLGWSLPVARLRYWVLGLPAPGAAPSMTVDAEGRAAQLQQDGWRIAYTEYQTLDDLPLPRRIELADGTHSFRLLIDRWSGVGASIADGS